MTGESATGSDSAPLSAPACLEGVAETLAAPALRDLAWLCRAPDLVTLAGYPGRPDGDALGLATSAALSGWLAQQTPRAGEAQWSRLRLARLGHYHERLWHYLLDHAPQTRLLAHGVRVAERRHTLGEMDMIYRTRRDPTPIHLEVAIKFYLGLPEGPGAAAGQSRWIGPGGFDSLALKSSHMARRQLAFSATPAARRALRHWLAPRDAGEALTPPGAQFAMPGVLFYPFHATLPAPAGSTPEHYRGLWCYARDWPALAATLPPSALGTRLPKPCWLAPPPFASFVPLRQAADAALARLQKAPVAQQLMLYLPPGGETRRVFIVPDDWPRQIPLPPAG
ncbi:DUF1853 family protein [Halomonas piscis]|uniref:DUF1853 family protein n=1 Tax=Halomonas piscis TaxID=3031727 RepID=A0ABY9Z1W4_9GAMM|nr:DUF1853 family protein [Halomonas piscis]WNK20590.1 DUF1853 family protein [Halomonas piscis]